MESSMNRVINSRNMRWAEHVEGNGERRTYRVLVGGRRKERAYLEDVGVNEKILLKWMFKRYVGEQRGLG
jgi:hypothetical protein